MTIDFSGLNEKQREAVFAQGVIRVIAGAGSGKTKALTYRIGRLVEEGIPPENILSIAFTRKAAGEMQRRLRELLGEKADRLACGTFHALCYRLLRVSGGLNGFEILDDHKQMAYLERVIGPDGLNLDTKAGGIKHAIGMAKNRLLDARKFAEDAEDYSSEIIAKAFSLYEEWKARDHLLDYDDLLLKCWQLLKTDRQALQRYRQKFRHILVDEFQDTNLAQLEIVRLLCPPQMNLFVVGDDWQNIYSWRGAEAGNIIAFEKIFPGAATIKLEQNYRSTKTIVAKSNGLISHNKVRTDKALWTNNPEGEEIEIIEAPDTDEEASLIVKRVKSLIEGGGCRRADISILYRTNAQSRPFEDECIRQKIPYRVVGSLGFYDRREIKDMIAYLRLIQNQDDDEAFTRIINVPPRYLGRAFLAELKHRARSSGRSLFACLNESFSLAYMGKSARAFQEMIRDLAYYHRRQNDLPKLIAKIRRRTNYDNYICRDEEIAPDDSRIQNLNELTAALARFKRIEDFLFYVQQIKAEKTEAENRDQTSLMTIHKSKGLEFRTVFIAGCSQGLLPHHKAMQDGGLEEERRLFYVGMTRAKERLYLCRPHRYQDKELKASQFLKEALPEGNGKGEIKLIRAHL